MVDGARFMGQEYLLGSPVDSNSHQKRKRSSEWPDSDDNDDTRMTYSAGKRRKPSERADSDSDSDSALVVNPPTANKSSMVNMNTVGDDQPKYIGPPPPG